MKTVGIKILKNNLSRYIKLVKEGEIVLISDRDEVVAELSKPVIPIPGKVSIWESFCNQLVRKGAMIPAKRKESIVRDLIKDLKPLPKEIDIQKILRETREDRF
jgi:antitoxin (DNA-binding transcriptional repressor) of toxin-antitoxin stability system